MSDDQFEGYVRVSTILAPFSGMGAIPKDILAKAAARGTAVHKAITGILLGFPEEQGFEHQGYVDSFKLWWADCDIINLNERLFDHDLKITGEYDLLYRDKDSKVVLVDFKTSGKEGKTWWLQGTAYDHLIALRGCKVDRIEFVHLSKEGFAPIVRVYEAKWNVFLKVFEMFNMFFANTKEFPEDI